MRVNQQKITRCAIAHRQFLLFWWQSGDCKYGYRGGVKIGSQRPNSPFFVIGYIKSDWHIFCIWVWTNLKNSQKSSHFLNLAFPCSLLPNAFFHAQNVPKSIIVDGCLRLCSGPPLDEFYTALLWLDLLRGTIEERMWGGEWKERRIISSSFLW